MCGSSCRHRQGVIQSDLSQNYTDGSLSLGSIKFISKQVWNVIFSFAFAFGVDILVQRIVEFLRWTLHSRQHGSMEKIPYVKVSSNCLCYPSALTLARTAKLSNPPKSKLSSVVDVAPRCVPQANRQKLLEPSSPDRWIAMLRHTKDRRRESWNA